ncbi:hypothetical protein NCCP2145_38570 [Pseudarthrobacter sp. NCCP-2145]|nr:hypothetical protein NCCP2145_38570 [Pseudarthrobacter sp. NCCP-2145]
MAAEGSITREINWIDIQGERGCNCNGGNEDAVIFPRARAGQ